MELVLLFGGFGKGMDGSVSTYLRKRGDATVGGELAGLEGEGLHVGEEDGVEGLAG